MRLISFTVLALACAAAALATTAPARSSHMEGEQPSAHAQVTNGLTQRVVVQGTVPSEATRVAILTRLRDVYGAARVVDHLEVGQVYAPPQWTEYITDLLDPSLANITGGKLEIDGNTVRLTGAVKNEALRQKVLSKAAKSLNPTYTIKSSLTVTARSTQDLLNNALDDRTITFESGSAVITVDGERLLDKIATILRKVGPTRLLIAGHTDNVGNRQANILLSIRRASAVKSYLVDHGVAAKTLGVTGYGPDRPVASNTTATGRARNRRIKFVVQQ